MPYVYRYIDLNKEEVVYIGKVTTYYDKDNTCIYDGLVKRHSQHKREEWYGKIGDENLLLQYIQVGTHSDADILETWLINYYDTGQLFNKAKLGWGEPGIDLYPCISGRWRNFRQGAISNTEEVTAIVRKIVDSFIRRTEGMSFNIETGLEWLCDDIREIRGDMVKASRISRFDAQYDFRREKK